MNIDSRHCCNHTVMQDRFKNTMQALNPSSLGMRMGPSGESSTVPRHAKPVVALQDPDADIPELQALELKASEYK